MKVQKLYYLAHGLGYYRTGELAEVLGVKMVIPREGLRPRPCLHIRFVSDGNEHYPPLSDSRHFELISKAEAAEKDLLDLTQQGVNLDDLQEEIEKLLTLLKDRQPGLMTWHDSLNKRFANLRRFVFQAD